ncbi:hypothetical protein [Priestia megaterium]|uniref:hypothetical protein n=1 Tax=Priestia megaterium TaxID=1404 RepID=UPI001FB30E5C|nr:hypothetical protein [Priestia megaterium]
MRNNNKTKIKVIDAICGAGKTSWAIQMINEAERVDGFGLRPKKKIHLCNSIFK